MRAIRVPAILIAGSVLLALTACSKPATDSTATSEISELPQSPPAEGSAGAPCNFEGAAYEHAHQGCFKHPDGVGQYLICENGVWRRSRYCELP